MATSSNHAKRPVAQRRVSTGDQLVQYYPAMRMYPLHPTTTMHHPHHPIHHTAATTTTAAAPLPPTSQQRYPGDYYYMYQQ